MKKKINKDPIPMMIPVKAFIRVQMPHDYTIRDLARLAWMLGVEIDFNARNIKKKRKKK